MKPSIFRIKEYMLAYYGPLQEEFKDSTSPDSKNNYLDLDSKFDSQITSISMSSIGLSNGKCYDLNGKNVQCTWDQKDGKTLTNGKQDVSDNGLEVKIVKGITYPDILGEKSTFNIKDTNESEISTDSNKKQFVNSWVRPLIAECLGTFLLVFLGSLSSVAELGIPGAAWSHGFTLGSIVAIFGNVSGAHVNPIITIGLTLTNKFGFRRMILYIIAQFIGSLIASSLFYISMSPARYEASQGAMITYNLSFNSMAGVFICETILMAFLLLVVLIMAVGSPGVTYQEPISCPIVGLIVGIALVACIFAGGTVSGAALNPVRVLGPAIIYTVTRGVNLWKQQYIYFVAQFAGCFIASVIYRFVLGGPNTKSKSC